MATEVIMKEDLNEFRKLLLADIRLLLGSKAPQENTKWLKNYQVKNMFRISLGTL